MIDDPSRPPLQLARADQRLLARFRTPTFQSARDQLGQKIIKSLRLTISHGQYHSSIIFYQFTDSVLLNSKRTIVRTINTTLSKLTINLKHETTLKCM